MQKDLKPKSPDSSEMSSISKKSELFSGIRNQNHNPSLLPSHSQKPKNRNLYDMIRQDGVRSQQSVVFTIPNKPKSALKMPLMTQPRAKNVSFQNFGNFNLNRASNNSGYLNIRNKGYLTSDIMGNSLDSKMLKVMPSPNIRMSYKQPTHGMI